MLYELVLLKLFFHANQNPGISQHHAVERK